jgi:hypothetical protein
MILVQNNNLAIANLKFLLICFELLSGLKINYHKSEVIIMGAPNEEHARVANLLNCQQGEFPFRYLGFTMSDKKLTIADNEPLVQLVGNRTDLGRANSCLQLPGLSSRMCVSLACLYTPWGCSFWQMELTQPSISIDAGFFGRAVETNASIIGSTGLRCVPRETRVVWGL